MAKPTGTTRQRWIESHPYLRGIEAFQALVEDAASGVAGTPKRPDWEAVQAESAAGVPLLRSERAAIDVVPELSDALVAMTERLAAAELPEALAGAVRALRERLRSRDDAAGVAAFVIGAPGAQAPPDPGLVRYLGWIALERILAPVVAEAAKRRTADAPRHGHCPTCGALPTMALLVEEAAGRARLLACGLCKTRWRYKRVGCPFCGTEEAGKLSVLEIDQEPALRLDVCEGCNGYVKTAVAPQVDPLLLADWPTLHLDVLAKEKGLERLGASIYELEG